MTPTTHSVDVSSAPTKTFERPVVGVGIAVTATSESKCAVFNFEDGRPKTNPPPHYKSIKDIAGKWGEDEKRSATLRDARRWIAGVFYDGQDGTVRTLRLKKGWSQAQLAAAIDTCQSHVARIESGTVSPTIDTCRRLCGALGIDMNTLDQALRRQEMMSRSRA